MDSFEVRQLKDWNQPKDGLIIPGGESTTQAKLLNELGLMEPVKEAIAAGLPAIVKAVTNYNDPKMLAELSEDLGEAMVGINEQEIALLMAERGK